MNKLTAQDLQFVVRRIPKDVRQIMTEHQVFLAGGFIRETISGGDVKDIDIFGQSKESLGIIADAFALKREVKPFRTENAITVLCPPRLPVQFITRWVFDSAGPLVESFDFTVCQAAVWFDRSLGLYSSAVSDDFYSDLAARRLVYTFPKRDEEAGGSMMRVKKFLKRGYNIQASSLAGVIARVAAKVDWARAESEERAAFVIAGLLREVDPLLVVDGLESVDEHEAVQGA
jgi:hypothetical protein